MKTYQLAKNFTCKKNIQKKPTFSFLQTVYSTSCKKYEIRILQIIVQKTYEKSYFF